MARYRHLLHLVLLGRLLLFLDNDGARPGIASLYLSCIPVPPDLTLRLPVPQVAALHPLSSNLPGLHPHRFRSRLAPTHPHPVVSTLDDDPPAPRLHLLPHPVQLREITHPIPVPGNEQDVHPARKIQQDLISQITLFRLQRVADEDQRRCDASASCQVSSRGDDGRAGTHAPAAKTHSPLTPIIVITSSSTST